ncbi:MAG: DUF697 domain-containing protein [Aureispira sp.]|nr:DUF697 domain-containing protein [Aureispira sp.]
MNNNKNPKDDADERAERAIRNHVMWSMGAGFIPFPIADFIAVAAVQLDMIRTLSNVYGVDFKETEGKAIITSLTGSGLSRLGANALVKMIPGVGTMLGGVSMAIMSGASTFALGQVFKRHFATGGTFLDFDTDRFKRYYDEQFEKGKTVAKDIKKEDDERKAAEKSQPKAEAKQDAPPKQEAPKAENKNSQIIDKLKELAELKEMGVITEEEFAQMKARLIENYG